MQSSLFFYVSYFLYEAPRVRIPHNASTTKYRNHHWMFLNGIIPQLETQCTHSILCRNSHHVTYSCIPFVYVADLSFFVNIYFLIFNLSWKMLDQKHYIHLLCLFTTPLWLMLSENKTHQIKGATVLMLISSNVFNVYVLEFKV